MDSLMRIYCSSLQIDNNNSCIEEIDKIIRGAFSFAPDIIVFPKATINYTDDKNCCVLQSTKEYLKKLLLDTKTLNSYIVLGLPFKYANKITNCTYVLHNGQVLAIIPDAESYRQPQNDKESLLSSYTTVFKCGNVSFSVLPCDKNNIATYSGELIKNGCDLIVVPLAEYPQKQDIRTIGSTVAELSKAFDCAYTICNASLPIMENKCGYGYCGIFECGTTLSFDVENRNTIKMGYKLFCCNDIDYDVIEIGKSQTLNYNHANIKYEFNNNNKLSLLREVNSIPFIKKNLAYATNYKEQLYNSLTLYLAKQIKELGSKRPIIHYNGDINSTFALCCCASAIDILGYNRKNIVVLTTKGYKNNQTQLEKIKILCNKLDVTCGYIDLTKPVDTFGEILGHDLKKNDDEYETVYDGQVECLVRDVAREYNGVVIDSRNFTDLYKNPKARKNINKSHILLNSELSATCVATLLSYISDINIFTNCHEELSAIVSTTSAILANIRISDNTMEKTKESIILYDFFLYYTTKYKMDQNKMMLYATVAFEGVYKKRELRYALDCFLGKENN